MRPFTINHPPYSNSVTGGRNFLVKCGLNLSDLRCAGAKKCTVRVKEVAGNISVVQKNCLEDRHQFWLSRRLGGRCKSWTMQWAYGWATRMVKVGQDLPVRKLQPRFYSILFSLLPGNAWFQIPYSEMSIRLPYAHKADQRATVVL